MTSGDFVLMARRAACRIGQRDAPKHFIETTFLRVQFFKLPAGLRDGLRNRTSEFAIARLVAWINAHPNHARRFFDDGRRLSQSPHRSRRGAGVVFVPPVGHHHDRPASLFVFQSQGRFGDGVVQGGSADGPVFADGREGARPIRREIQNDPRPIREPFSLSGPESASPFVSAPTVVATTAPASRCAELSRRELEVAALIARGMTNRQIANELVITEGTAANHVKHILARLQLSSRVQIATWAIEHGLLQRPAS